MATHPSKAELMKEVETLRREFAELRSHETLSRRTSKGLQIVERQLAGIIQSTMDAIITIDDEQRVVQFNAAAEGMFCCSANEAMGKLIDRFLPERFRAKHRQHVKNFGKTMVTDRRMGALGAVSGLRMNGEEFPIEASISQFKKGKQRFFTVILRDVTERQGLESQLRQTERLAELGTLAAGMAHEIGTPMNVILGRAEYLMRKTSEESTKKELTTIVAQVERITKIMHQLLSFARQKPIERRLLALSLVVHEIVDVLQERLEKNRIRLEMDLQPNCPTVLADRDRMGQVLLNLIVNAIQAMSVEGTLSLTLRCRNDHVLLSVSDTGCGIPPDHVPKLFTPFFSTKEVGEGTGLGLTVVHGIIEEHQGFITVESEPGRGATFHIHLPVHQTLAEPSPPRGRGQGEGA